MPWSSTAPGSGPAPWSPLGRWCTRRRGCRRARCSGTRPAGTPPRWGRAGTRARGGGGGEATTMSFQTRLSKELIERYTRAGHWGSETFSQILARQAAAHPEREVLVDGRHRVTYDELKG